jgi:hypothetical protein
MLLGPDLAIHEKEVVPGSTTWKSDSKAKILVVGPNSVDPLRER